MKFTTFALLLALPLGTLAQEAPDTATELTSESAAKLVATTWTKLQQAQKDTALAELEANKITLGDKEMRFGVKVFGEAPKGGHSLFISMHGGGNAPAQINDQQWKNQIGLYQPKEGIYVAPRAPTNTWNLWHESHIDDFFDRLIANYVLTGQVNPNKVYLMGYSAGGDGVYQLAPRMADRFAAAAMMAGHPNDASPLGLRNLPFALYMGGKDAAYDRNKIAAQWGEKLAALQKEDPKGYTHRVKIYPEFGHWMNREDAEALPWMAKFTRNPWPKKVVWVQSGGHLHQRFYWLEIDPKTAKKGETITADVSDNQIAITTDNAERKSITVNLHDSLINLDQPVTISVNGKQVFSDLLVRSPDWINRSLKQRPDPKSAAYAGIELTW